MVKNAVILLGLASASACLSADYSVADAGPCPVDDVCREGWVCVVGYCVPSADDVPVCGDGLHQDYAGEACDDGNQIDTDGCRNSCVIAACSDGVVYEGVEACDDGNEVDTDVCTNTCTVARCGDGVAHEGVEACDDGNNDENDGCTTLCAPPRCGDGIAQNNEACDDGNDVDTDACLAGCVAATCGDGVVYEGVEACDDRNEVETDTCTNTCTAAACGDGVQRRDIAEGEDGFESCDDGNFEDDDSCLSDCSEARCGDGIVYAGQEACDDGDQEQTDACLNDCSAASCGDGFTRADLDPGAEGYEACDDGNTDNGDDCDTSCRVLADPGETQATASRDCQTLKARLPGLRDGVYWINPDQGDTNNAFRAICKMSVENSGWTQVVNMASGAETWDAWSDDFNLGDARHDNRNFGIRMRAFSDAPDGTGEDLEFFFMNGLDPRGPIYTGVHKSAWDPNQTEGNFDNSFSYRQIEWNAWSVCNQAIGRDNNKWSWSIAKGGAAGSNCANYRAGGGFMIEGGDSNPNQALILNGLGLFQNTREFLLRIYVRRRPQ